MEYQSETFLPLNYFIGKEAQTSSKTWNMNVLSKENFQETKKNAEKKFYMYYSSMTNEQYQKITKNTEHEIIISKKNLDDYLKNPDKEQTKFYYIVRYLERQISINQENLKILKELEPIIETSMTYF